MSKTKVIFRKWKSNGDVIALFPEIAATCSDAWLCSSFEHVGQHGAADPSIISQTKPATPQEYADLKAELEAYPYEYVFEVVHKFTRAHHEARKAELTAMKVPSDLTKIY
jgi:hypothetical protein